MIGQRFAKLVVLEAAGKTRWKELLWRCRCDCGQETIVRGKGLRAGQTRSCGCLSKTQSHGLIHGGKKTRLYRLWIGMKDRCNNSRSKDFPQYGGRGITICDAWRNDFVAFREWALPNGYRDDLSIDRRDGARGYEPDNCRWVTVAENTINRSQVKLSKEIAQFIRERVAAGATHTAVARELGVSRSNVSLICEGKVWA